MMLKIVARLDMKPIKPFLHLLATPPEQPYEEFGIDLIRNPCQSKFMGHISREGKILGSIFLHKFPPSPAAVIGPLTIHPSTEGGAGKKLMNAVLTHAHEQNYGQIRLVQSPSHIYSFVLYTKCMGSQWRWNYARRRIMMLPS